MRRRSEDPPGPAQSDVQRREVHRSGPGPPRSRTRRGGPELRRPRLRRRHRRGASAQAVPEVLPGRRLQHPQVRGHRAGPGDLPRTLDLDGRGYRRAQHPRSGLGLPSEPAVVVRGHGACRNRRRSCFDDPPHALGRSARQDSCRRGQPGEPEGARGLARAPRRPADHREQRP